MYYVYVIWARDEDGEEVRYYGHTHDMKERKTNHKNSYNAWVRAGRPDKVSESGNASRSVFVMDMDDWSMDVLHELDCDEEEASRVEGNYIRYNKCVNRKMDRRTNAQYHQDNRDTRLQQMKQYQRAYYQDNRAAILAQRAEKVPCPCGVMVRHSEMARHLRSQKHAKRMQQSTSS